MSDKYRLPITPPNAGSSYREVPGYPGYLIGDDGSLWSSWGVGRDGSGKRYPRWRRNSQKSRTKYLTSELVKYPERIRKQFAIHRLVLLAFRGPLPKGMVSRHLNGDSRDNRLVNLAYGTHQDNAKDKAAYGRPQRRATHPRTHLTEEDVQQIRDRAERGETHRAIAKDFGVARCTVTAIVNQRNWRES